MFEVAQYFSLYSILPTIILLLVVIVLMIKLAKLKRTLSNLRKDTEEQGNIQQQRNDFLSMLTHELRSPLSIMKGASDLILKDAHNLNKKQIEILLTQIRTSSSDMLKLVNNILDVAKIDSGRFTISKTFGNINKTLRDESDYHTTLAGIKNIQINVQLDEAIPSFNFDAQRVGHVVNNMLANAIKAMRDGGTINLSSKKHQKRVEIVVADSGDGLDEVIKDKIFDLDSRDKIKGLGLVVAKSVVKAHGGEIRVENNKPKGSKFIFTLPLS